MEKFEQYKILSYLAFVLKNRDFLESICQIFINGTMKSVDRKITQVNEMLTQMESYPYPFVCTKNLMDNLDKASLRRFTFKVAYDYITEKQVQLAFKHCYIKIFSNIH